MAAACITTGAVAPTYAVPNVLAVGRGFGAAVPMLPQMPTLKTSLTSSFGPFLPKMVPLGVEQAEAEDTKMEAPPSTVCHGSLLCLGGDSAAGHHKVLSAGQRVCPTCQSSRLSVPLDRVRILVNADECQWSKAREFYVAWSVAPEVIVSARRWKLASPEDGSNDLVVFASADGAAKADLALGAGGTHAGAQQVLRLEEEASFSMCSRVKTFCPARNFGRSMGRGCVMHYQKRAKFPAAGPGPSASNPAVANLLLEVGAHSMPPALT